MAQDNNNFRLNGLNPLAYMGVNPVTPVPFVCRPFDPTPTDYANFILGTVWLNTTTEAIWWLVKKANFVGTWIQITGGSGTVISLTSNSGGPILPTAGNINVVGDGTTIVGVGTPGSSTITLSTTGAVATSYLTDDANSAVPALGVLTIHGGTGITTSSSGSTVTITATGGGGTVSSFITSPATGTATPAAGVITVAGTFGITATTGGSTITLSGSGVVDVVPYIAVTHAMSPYTVLGTDYYLGCDVTAGVISILLPNAPATGRVFIAKDNAGLAATSNITITTVGGAVTIDGATSFVMNTAYESANVIFNGTSYEIW